MVGPFIVACKWCLVSKQGQVLMVKDYKKYICIKCPVLLGVPGESVGFHVENAGIVKI